MKGTAPDRSDLQTLLTKANNSKTKSASLDWLFSAKYAYTVTVEIKDEDKLPLWTLWDMNGTQPKEVYSFNIEIDEFLEYLKPYGTVDSPGLHVADEEPAVHNNVLQFKRRTD